MKFTGIHRLQIEETQLDKGEEEMARGCYGYGRWGAPYWFIGPEQGQASWENNALTDRIEAFRKLSKEGLSDCREFHKAIRETRWHRERPALQSTWRRLELLLMAYLGKLTGDKLTDDEILRTYQRDQWGSSTGETCVIELSGLPASSFKVSRERERFLQERTKFIRHKIENEKPVFVVIYGKSQMEQWKRIAGLGLDSHHVLKVGSTNVVFAPHPVAYQSKDQDWVELGQCMRQVSSRETSG